MEKSFAAALNFAAKLVALLSIVLSSGVAYGYYSGVYLYCTNKDEVLKGYAYNSEANGFQPFIDQHGTASVARAC